MKVGSIGANAFEDGIEDMISDIMYQRMRFVVEPLRKMFESDEDDNIEKTAFNDGMQSFFMTLSMGLTIYAMQKVTAGFLVRGGKMMSALFAYMAFGKLKKKAADYLRDRSKGKVKGKVYMKKIGFFIGADRTPERIEISKMAQREVESFDKHSFHYQQQAQGTDKTFSDFTSSTSERKMKNHNKDLAIFTDLSKRGAWQNTNEHKRIYENATSHKLSTTGLGSWSKLYLELNKYTEVHKSADGVITNLATSLSRTMANKGMN